MKMRWNGLTSPSDLGNGWLDYIYAEWITFTVAIYGNIADYQFDIYRVMHDGIGRIRRPIYCFTGRRILPHA